MDLTDLTDLTSDVPNYALQSPTSHCQMLGLGSIQFASGEIQNYILVRELEDLLLVTVKVMALHSTVFSITCQDIIIFV